MQEITTKKLFKHELPNGNVQEYGVGTFTVSADVVKSAKKQKALAGEAKPLPASTRKKMLSTIKTLEGRLAQVTKTLEHAQADLAKVDPKEVANLKAEALAAAQKESALEDQVTTLKESITSVLDIANNGLSEDGQKVETLEDLAALMTAAQAETSND